MRVTQISSKAFRECQDQAMSSAISSIGWNYPSYKINAPTNWSQRRQDFQSLANALNSNDLQGAQTAFAALQKDSPQLSKLIQNNPNANSANPLATDFQNLSQALSSGDLSSAQAAFAKLQQDLQSVGAGHLRHHHGGGTIQQADAGNGGSQQAIVDSDGDHDGSTGQPSLSIQV
jgi:hypothetical protein